MDSLVIPSPHQGVWHLGAVPVRAYALCIIVGIVAATWLTERRWRQRGGAHGQVSDVLVWAVPFGVVGARAYHVLTDPELYFGSGRNPWRAFEVWQGGLGIWGAIAGGALGAYVATRRQGISFVDFADVAAPGIALAQAIGRWGNWFNQELFGRPTDLPWGLAIDRQHRPSGYEHFTTFHPTFLYESLWDLGIAGLLLWSSHRFRLTGGRVFALYVMAYTLGRGWIETLRIDHANTVLGLRLNVWTCLVVFLAASTYFVVARAHVNESDDTQTSPVGHDDAPAGARSRSTAPGIPELGATTSDPPIEGDLRT